MKAIGYVRVSTEDQAMHGVSLDAQRAKIQAYCALQDFELSELIADEGRSAKTTDRAGLQRAMKAIAKGEAQALVVVKIDRLSRSTMDTLELVQQVEKAGATFHSIQEKIDTESSTGRFFLTLLAAFAQMERDQIAERTRAALKHKQAEGQHVGTIPYGYRIGGGGRLTPIPGEIRVIEQVRALRAAGHTLQAIADHLNASQIPTKRGGRWRPNSVSNIIAAPGKFERQA
jgi:site-specific DNA recombinase